MTIQTTALCGALCALGVATGVQAAPGGEPPAAKITVADLTSHFGETLDAWRAQPAPAGFAGYDRACRAAQWKAASPLASGAPQPVTACTFQKTFGSVAIRPSIRLEPGDYRVRQVTWYFHDGRMAAVAADMSGNAYDAVVRAFTKAYGPATQTLRRRASTRDGVLPQTVMAWRGQGAVATLTDPAPPRWNLQVVVAQGPLAASRSAQAGAAPRA